LFLIASGITAPWYLTRLMHFLPIGLQSLRTPTAVWALILPIWAALAAAVEFTAPAASNLWVFPLLTTTGIAPGARTTGGIPRGSDAAARPRRAWRRSPRR
jgi:hypothetical protein